MENVRKMCGKWMEHVQYGNLWKCHYSSIPAPTTHFETWEIDMVCLCSRINTAGWINNGGHAPEKVREVSLMIKSKIKHMMWGEVTYQATFKISPDLACQAKHDLKNGRSGQLAVSLCWCWVSPPALLIHSPGTTEGLQQRALRCISLLSTLRVERRQPRKTSGKHKNRNQLLSVCALCQNSPRFRQISCLLLQSCWAELVRQFGGCR